jgi:uncharacterized membrane protein YcaP (DUF421 family)
MLFVLFRFVLRRDAGSVGLADILMIVVIADAAQNGMAGDYKSVTDAVVLVGTIAAWNYWFDWMSFKFRWFARFSEPRPERLIERGKINSTNLAHNMLTVEELRSQLRQHGVVRVGEVREAILEPDGKISVIKYKKDRDDDDASSRRSRAQ